MLPFVLARFRAAYPAIALRISVGNTEDILARVRRGRAPLGLVEGHARAAGLRLSPFVDDELVAVCGMRDGLPAFRVRRAADLARTPILWREPGSGTRAVMERALRRAEVRRGPTSIDHEIGSSEAILGAAAAGLGVAFGSRWAIQPDLESGRLVAIAGLDLVIRRTFRWAMSAGSPTGAARLFLDFAQRHPPTVTG